MAGTIKVKNVQLGDNVTATQNFVWSENSDGTAKLARGNVGATTQDILTVDASGRVSMPQSVVAFSAYQSTLQSIPNATPTKVLLQTEEFDTTNAFDSVTNYRFLPLVAGYYQISASIYAGAATSYMNLTLYKNGAIFKRIGSNANTVNYVPNGTVLVYLNGSTDYVELYAQQGTGVAQNTAASQELTWFQGILIAKA